MSTEFNLHCTQCGYGVWIASWYMCHKALFPTGEKGEANLLKFLFDHRDHPLKFMGDNAQDLPEMDGEIIETWGDDGTCKHTPIADWEAGDPPA